MAEDGTILVMLSVLVLVVIELSKTAREENLERAVRTGRNPLFAPLPNLGFFTAIHFINVFILTIGIVTVFVEILQRSSLLLTLSLIIGGTVLAILPIFEAPSLHFFNREGLQNWPRNYFIGTGIYVVAILALFTLTALFIEGPIQEWLAAIGFVIILLAYVYFPLDKIEKEFLDD